MASNGTLEVPATPNGTSTPQSGISTPGSESIPHFLTSPVKLWEHPDPESTQMHSFKKLINCKYGLDLEHYEDLHKWSVENTGPFWSEVWDFVGVKGDKGSGEVGA